MEQIEAQPNEAPAEAVEGAAPPAEAVEGAFEKALENAEQALGLIGTGELREEELRQEGPRTYGVSSPTEPVEAPAGAPGQVPAEDDGDFTVIANNPEQMLQSQGALIRWANGALEKAKETLQERKDLLESAKKSKIRTTPWVKLVKEAETSVCYYEKMLLALQQGYFIVPDFPMSIIAVRTNRKRVSGGGPMPFRAESAPQLHEAPRMLSPGEGRYVSPQLDYRQYSMERKHGEQVRFTQHYDLLGFKQVDMPVRFVKPKVLQDFDKAMQEKIFDEIGILPLIKENHKVTRARHPDPMLFGRIHRKVGTKRVTATFLISWWLDTSTL